MKQDLEQILPIKIGCNLDDVDKIDFIFVQGGRRKQFTYPSYNAQRSADEDNVIYLYWTEEDSWGFMPETVLMDTKIYLKGCEQNPETSLLKFAMNRTLFRKGESTRAGSTDS